MNTKTKHTPGPWILRNVTLPFLGYEIAASIDRKSAGIARIPFTNEIDTANARLIAAAPALLEACKTMLVRLEDYAALIPDTDGNETITGGHDNVCDAARSAIAAVENGV